MMRTAILAAGIAAAAATGVSAQQQGEPTQEQLETAVKHFRIIGGAMQVEEVPGEMKNALFGCIYSAPFREISEKATAVIEANDQLSVDNNQHVLMALAAVCGFKPQAGSDN
ncbi:hypothetical protein [Pacificimonas flava]|uniref:DUF732 domain-containing protein n=1 Tax=Pacificimonas flava TaxID=1234595 RepID=M2U8G2_9SPHN|nr:hypothetical protein [Pacificimonas flava]EMD84262.1 hypothetical protein C725_0192 [Pacificimonas flava]MBB5279862.1 hypothetical protein [Pacificimonas flava]